MSKRAKSKRGKAGPKTPITESYARGLLARGGMGILTRKDFPLALVECKMALLKLKRRIREIERG